MNFVLQPWQLLLLIFAGWVNRQQQQVNEYLRTENQVLREKFGSRRILLNDDQRRRLAVKGKVLGRKLLGEVGTLVTPDTILRWHRLLVAQKWDYSSRRRRPQGRPPVTDEIRNLVLRLARENPRWGYDRIQGALANLGHRISDRTVGNILNEHGIETAPQRRRQTTWKTFLKAHWGVLATVDFPTTVRRCHSPRMRRGRRTSGFSGAGAGAALPADSTCAICSRHIAALFSLDFRLMSPAARAAISEVLVPFRCFPDSASVSRSICERMLPFLAESCPRSRKVGCGPKYVSCHQWSATGSCQLR